MSKRTLESAIEDLRNIQHYEWTHKGGDKLLGEDARKLANTLHAFVSSYWNPKRHDRKGQHSRAAKREEDEQRKKLCYAEAERLVQTRTVRSLTKAFEQIAPTLGVEPETVKKYYYEQHKKQSRY